jgi:hypothetical protein
VPDGQIPITHETVKGVGFCLPEQLDYYKDKGWSEATDDQLADEAKRIAALPDDEQAQAPSVAAEAELILGPGPKQHAAIAAQAERDAQAAANQGE